MLVRVITSLGSFDIELNQSKAPITVANFLQYVDAKFYDGSCFHRVIKGFMIQGGGFSTGLARLPRRSPIKNEWQNGLQNVVGSVAMARQGGNPDSATSQFFVNVVDNDMLDEPQDDGGAYCVFGKVVDGMDIVQKIENVPTTKKKDAEKQDMKDVPVTTVEILSIRRV